MAVTKEQLEEAIRSVEAKKADPSISDSERASLQADSVKLAAAYKSIGTSTQTTPLTTAADPANTNFWADSAKRGFTDFLYNTLLKGTKPPTVLGAEALPFTESEAVRTETQRTVNQLFGIDADPSDPDYEMAVREGIGRKSTEWFAGGNRQPETAFQRYGGIAVESIASDPVMSAIGGRGLLGAAINVGSSAVAAGTGAIGSDAISGAAEAMGATPEWQKFWGTAGGLVTGLIGGTGSSIVGGGLEGWSQASQQMKKQKSIQDGLDKASDFLVTSNMRTVIDDIVTTEPNIDQHIETIKTMGELIPNFEIAPGIALYDNAIIRKNMETLLKESPKFRAGVEANLRDTGNAILTRRSALFGTTDQDEIYRQMRQAAAANFNPARGNYGINLSNVVRRRDQIDNAIDRVLTTARTEAEPVVVGQAARRLIDAKEKAVKAEMSVRYEKLIGDYTEAGMVFPEESVANLWNLVDGALDAQLFTPFPSLVGKVNRLLRPTKVSATEEMPSLGAMLGGRATTIRTPEVTKYRELSLEQLDSLKIELNAALRSGYGSSAYPLLRQMKAALTDEIDKLPGFGEAYRAADRSFYQKLGIPFDAAGLSQLDSLKFTETVGNYLAKPERARDFLSFVGEEGVPVVKDAILMRLRRTAFDAEGNFKPANYAKFLAENRTLVETVPGLREELGNVGRSVAQMDNTKARLDDQFNMYAKQQADNLLTAVHRRGVDGAISDMLGSPMKMEQYARTIKNLDPESARTARQGVRSALIDRAFQTPSAREFIKEHASVFDEWFGSTYTESIEALSYANDMLRRVDPDRMAFATSYKEADALAKSTGTSGPQVGSLVRDRISSGAHKASILFSRWFTMRTAGRRDDEMASLLLNPAGMQRIADTARAQRENQIDISEAVRRISGVMAATLVGRTALAEEGAEKAQVIPRQ
jgi:hypothetical protein